MKITCIVVLHLDSCRKVIEDDANKWSAHTLQLDQDATPSILIFDLYKSFLIKSFV
jgi:hypothetical protein